MVYFLPSITISTSEPGLWYDHDRRDYRGGFGVSLKFFAGECFRHGLRPKYWLRMWKGEKFPSAWKEHDPDLHYAVRFWLPIAPFFSISIGDYGFYIGFKVAKRLNPDIFTEKELGSEVLIPSVTTRRTRQ